MIYLQTNKVNKIGNYNKIYLKDNIVYLGVKNEDTTITKPSYLKSAFAYDSFSEDGITDVITNTKYDWQLGSIQYKNLNFTINNHYNTIYQTSEYSNIKTNPTDEPLMKDFKSVLLKIENILTNCYRSFMYKDNDGYIEINNIVCTYGDNKIYFNDINIDEVLYVYFDFNGSLFEKSKVLFLNKNFDILKELEFDTVSFNTYSSISENSLFYINFSGLEDNNNSERPIDFYYQCYCDKFLSIYDIKEIDNYMMKR